MSVKRTLRTRAGRAKRALGRRLVGQQIAPAPTISMARAPLTRVRGTSALSEDDDHWLAKVDAISDVVVANRDLANDTRQLPPAIIDALIGADFGRMMVPPHIGGHGAGLTTAVRVVEALARLDGSTAWNTWVMTGHGRLFEYLPEDVAAEVNRSPSGVLAGNISPMGRADVEDGGYRLWGQWPFGSATAISDFIAVGAMVFDRGEVRRHADGTPILLALVLPKQRCRILDTWRTTGLRGTASNDIEVQGVFIPEHFTFDSNHTWTPLGGSAYYGRPYGEYAPMLMSAVAVGVASDALDAYRQHAAAKSMGSDPNWKNMLPVVQQRIGEALAMIESARAHLYSTALDLEALKPSAPDQSLRSRRAGAHVAERAADATSLLYRRGGTGAIYEDRRLERCFRDVVMVGQHGLISASAYAESGRHALAVDG